MTDTEELWRGAFGDAYSARSPGEIANNAAFFARALQRCAGAPGEILELGAGVGNNLRALDLLFPTCKQTAVEINRNAAAKIADYVRVHHCSLFDFKPPQSYDLVLAKGVLIHLPQEKLRAAYDLLLRCARRYVLIAEYASAEPRMVPYRGHDNALWTRPFGREFADYARELVQLLDYGFVGKMDLWPQDDLTYWLFEVV